jgi:PAS domain S-box-containing protein
MASKQTSRHALPDEWYRWMTQSLECYAIFSTDLQSRILTWDRGAEELFGYSVDDVIGENARFIFTPEDIENKVPEQELATARDQRCALDERWHVKKDGTVFWASGYMARIVDDHLRHVGFAKIVRASKRCLGG